MIDTKPPHAGQDADQDMRRSYVLVMVVWVIVLAGLYFLQTSFS